MKAKLNLFSSLGICDEYDVAIGYDNTPFIYIGKLKKEDEIEKEKKEKIEKNKKKEKEVITPVWWPICSHDKTLNNNAADLICKKVTDEKCSEGEIEYISGSNDTIPMDSFMIGECALEDESLSSCSGGCNNRDIGGSCKQNQCTKDNAPRIKINCFRDDDEKCTKPKITGKTPLFGNSCKSNHLKKLI